MLTFQMRENGLKKFQSGAGPVGQSYSTSEALQSAQLQAQGPVQELAAHDFCHAKCWGGQQHVTPLYNIV